MGRKKTHWLTWSRIYMIWSWMKQRCDKEYSISYSNYWWRWILYDKEWSRFDNFYRDMLDWYEDHKTLERIDNNWNYCKENCRRATYKEQANNKRNNESLIIWWVTKNIIEWIGLYNIDYRTFYTRVRWWMDRIAALTTKVEERNKKILFNWESLTLNDRSKKLWIDYKTLYRRIYIKKYPINIALNSERYDWKRIV